MIEDVLDGDIRAIEACTAVHEDGFRQFPPGLKHGGKLPLVQRRTPAFFHRNVPDVKSGNLIELDQGSARIQVDLIFGAEADDGLDADGADGVQPELQSTHGNRQGLAAGVTGPRRAVEGLGNNGSHKSPPRRAVRSFRYSIVSRKGFVCYKAPEGAVKGRQVGAERSEA